MKKRWLSVLLVLASTILLILLSFNANKYPDKLIWTDMEGYYVYLPATFIYGGFKKEAVRDTNYIKAWPGTDKIYTKYTSGVAILEAPFFFAAHILSYPLGYPSDGHSLIYCYFLMFAAIFYMLAGMYLLWRSIQAYYSNTAALVSLASLFLGTNMYYYTMFQPSMSHIYSFFIFAAVIYLTDKIIAPREKNSSRYFLLFGLSAGIMVLIRPTSAIVLLYPLYRWSKQTDEKWAYIQKNALNLLIMAVAAIAVWIPQLIYWKSVTDHWFMWSYGDETFKYWKEPKLFRVLFDAWNGWLLYSPIAIIPLVGLVLGRHSNRHSERIIMLILALATYLFASWWAWWFGGAFGHRCYVEYYALLAMPFAAAAERAFKSTWSKVVFIALCLLLIYYNLGLTYHYQAPWDGPNWTYDSVWNEIKRLF